MQSDFRPPEPAQSLNDLEGSNETPHPEGPAPQPPHYGLRWAMPIVLVSVIGLAMLTIGLFLAAHLSGKSKSLNSQNVADNYSVSSVPDKYLPALPPEPINLPNIRINGNVLFNGDVVVQPTSHAPSNPTAGELYYDKNTNHLFYYNGLAFVGLQQAAGSQYITNVTNNITNVTNTSNGGGSSNSLSPNSFLSLQNTSPGTSQSGNFNITGTGIAAALKTADLSASNALIKSNSATSLQVQNANGSSLFTADTKNNAIILGNDGTPGDVVVRGGAATGVNVQGSNLTFQASDGTGAGGSGNINFQTAAVGGQVLFDSSTVATVSPFNGVWGYTIPMTIKADSSSMLVVSLSYTGYQDGNPPYIPSVLWNGTHLSKLYEVDNTCSSTAANPVEVWYLLNPGVGSKNLQINFENGYGSANVVAQEVYNVDQSNPFGTPVSQCSTNTSSATVTASTSLGQVVLDTTSYGNGGYTAIVPNSDQSTVAVVKGMAVSTKMASGATTTMSDSDSAGWSTGWLETAVPINTDSILSSADTYASRLTITASGNVGIDNSNPQYTLDVGGVGNFSSGLLSSTLDTATADSLSVGSNTATSISIGNPNKNITTTINGTALVKPTSGNDSTTAFQVQNAGGNALLTADTVNNAIVLGNDGTPTDVTIRGGQATGNGVSGGNMTFDASNGTGTGGSGDIIFRTGSNNGALIHLDTGSVQTGSTIYSSASWNETISSNNNRLLLVSVVPNSGYVQSMTYAGQSLTQLATEPICTIAQYANCGHEVWYLVNPPSGTNSLSINTNLDGEAFYAEAFYGVDQSNPLTGLVSQAGQSNTITQTLNTSLHQYVFDSIATASDGINTYNTGQTRIACIYSNGSPWDCSQIQDTSSPTTTLSTTLGFSGKWSDITAVINPIPSTSPDPLSDRLHIAMNGNVGINNSSPQYTLDVGGTGHFSNGVLTPSLDTASASALNIGSNNATSLVIGNTTNNINTTVAGTAIFRPDFGQDSSTEFQIQDASGSTLFNVDTLNQSISLGAVGGTIKGHNVIGANQNSGGVNVIEASRIQTGGLPEQVTSLSVYFGNTAASPNNDYEVAIYTDSSGSPGTLVSGSTTASTAISPNSWNTINDNVSLSANSTYWLAVMTNTTDGSLDQTYYDNGGNSYALMNSATYNSWPNTFTNNFSNGNSLSIYANIAENVQVNVSGTFTLNGHFVSGNLANLTTGVTPGSAADCGGTASASLTGNDTLGTITVTTGSGTCSTGTLATVNFASAFGSPPRALISADNASSAGLSIFHTSSTTQLVISTVTTPSPSTTYTFDYGTGQ